MGYKRAKAYKLTFEDHPGLELYMRGISVDGFKDVARHAAQLKGTDFSALQGGQLEAALAAVDALFDGFAARLVSWNLEDDDGPVPATRAGVGTQDLDFILELVTEWMEATASVDTPLKQPSASSPPAGLGLSEAMEPLSPSPGS